MTASVLQFISEMFCFLLLLLHLILIHLFQCCSFSLIGFHQPVTVLGVVYVSKVNNEIRLNVEIEFVVESSLVFNIVYYYRV